MDLKGNEQNTSPAFTVSTCGVKLAPTEYAIPSTIKCICGKISRIKRNKEIAIISSSYKSNS